MSQLHITGGRRLGGAIPIHGAKNSVLPLLAATLLCHGESELHGCPRLSDVDTSLDILRHLGCRVTRQDDVITVCADAPTKWDIPDTLMRRMRSSIVFFGAMTARLGQAQLSFPGGCELGPRPIDLHLSALRRLGATIEEAHGSLHSTLSDRRFHGTAIPLSFPSVGATENTLLAAVTAEGTTTILGAAREPEIRDLADFLIGCGAHITFGEDGAITVEGVPELHGCVHTVIPDRIETATYMAATAVTGGTTMLSPIDPAHIASVIPVLEETGCRVKTWERELLLSAPTRLRRIRLVRTLPYPGFPTDAAAPLLAMSCVAEGTSVFVETIFEGRYKYVDELRRLGAHIKTEGRIAV
ncbi:MAG: UDP-N-acetylglucosamine 1-carboxyvinyltransferase, partial [Clostridia bacterium]|nr:UDP-N-acetylglucosamine 1-carboxyvinyltransferase [Clostridia bacterium]